MFKPQNNAYYTALNKEREHINQQKTQLNNEANGSQQYQQKLTSFTLKNSIFTMLGIKNVTNYKNAFEAY